MTKINLHKLIVVFKKKGCTQCQWNNVKCGDDIIIESCKACFDQNTCLKNRKMIRRVSRQHLMSDLILHCNTILNAKKHNRNIAYQIWHASLLSFYFLSKEGPLGLAGTNYNIFCLYCSI